MVVILLGNKVGKEGNGSEYNKRGFVARNGILSMVPRICSKRL